MASSEDSRADTKPLFNFLIKVPHIDNIIMDEPAIPVELELDEKRKAREAILFQVKDKIVSTETNVLNYAYVKAKYLSAIEFVQSKITEVESLESVVDKADDVLSIDEITNQICEIGKNIMRCLDTTGLEREEQRKLMRKMALLGQLRIILSDNAGQASECANSKHGIRRITEFKEKPEESLKIARKELDILKESALKARTAVFQVERKHDDDMKQIEHLKDMYIAAENDCKAVKAKLVIIREKRSQRMSVLFDYMEDAAYYSRDPEQLSDFCRRSVENFMELWNEDEEFRRQYVRMMEKDEMVSDEVDVAVSEMDEIKLETITENTNWKTKKVDAQAKNKKARGKKKRRRADKLINNDGSWKEPQKSLLQSIAKSVPPTLGNINKKILQQVMWAGITSVFVYLLVFPNFIIKWRKLFY